MVLVIQSFSIAHFQSFNHVKGKVNHHAMITFIKLQIFAKNNRSDVIVTDIQKPQGWVACPQTFIHGDQVIMSQVQS